MKANKVISILTAALVLFLAGSAFVLSYDALLALGLAHGIRPGLAWLWPLSLDAFMIAASLAVLRSSLNKERTLYPWALVGAFTVASIAFNVLHAERVLLAQAIAALPPAVVFLSFELLMGQTKATIKRQAILNSLAELNSQADTQRQALDALTANVATLGAKKLALQGEVAELQKAKKYASLGNLDDANAKRQADKTGALNTLVSYLGANPDATLTAAGEHIGRSRQTVSNYLDELEAAGRISRNGGGVKVTGG
jgi:hypothetical protein